MSETQASRWPAPGELKNLRFSEQVRILFDLTLMRYPSAKLPPESVAAYRADWQDMLRECGTQRFLTGVRRACVSTSFFPTEADLAKNIPAPTPNSYSWKLTEEDLARRARGERSYGELDIKFLWKLHRTAREKRKGAPMSEGELDALLVDLDGAIDVVERAKGR